MRPAATSMRTSWPRIDAIRRDAALAERMAALRAAAQQGEGPPAAPAAEAGAAALVDRAGFEPAYGQSRADLQSAAFNHSATCPGSVRDRKAAPLAKGAGPVNAPRACQARPPPPRERAMRRKARQATQGREPAPFLGPPRRRRRARQSRAADRPHLGDPRGRGRLRDRSRRSRSPSPTSPISAGWCRATRRTRAWSPRSSGSTTCCSPICSTRPRTAGRCWCSTRSPIRTMSARSCARPRPSARSALVTQDRHAPPESGALAKAASGALETVPWVRVVNLARALDDIAEAGFWRIGLTGEAEMTLAEALGPAPRRLVLGAEGEGMRHNTEAHCDALARLPISGDRKPQRLQRRRDRALRGGRLGDSHFSEDGANPRTALRKSDCPIRHPFNPPARSGPGGRPAPR